MTTTDVMTSGPSHFTRVCELLAVLEQLRVERKTHDGDSKEYLAISDEIALVERMARHHTRLMEQAYDVLRDLRGPLNKLPLSQENRGQVAELTADWLQAVQ